MKLARTETPRHGVALLWTSRTISLYFAWAVISYVTYYCTDYLGLSAGIIGTLMLLSKIADCISNFLIANYVDNHSSKKWGKVRHHEIHIVLLWIDVIIMFSIPSGWSDLAKYIFIFLFYTMNCAVFQTFLSCTDAIYLRRAFKDDNQRTLVQTVSGGVGMVAMYLGVALMPILTDYFEDIPGGWTYLVLLCGVPMAIGPLLLIDVMMYGEWKNGKLAEGAVFAATGLGTTLGAGVGQALSGIVLGLFGYDGTLEVQSATAILGIKVCYAVVPTILMLVAVLLFFLYDLDKKMPQINADLEERHAAAQKEQ